jgi:hypothetical protein
MKIIEHEPQFWFLLQDGIQLLLDVSCEYSFVGYSFLMVLNEDEVSCYKKEGRDYLSTLAEAINFSCPIARGSSSPYKQRNIQSLRGDEVLDAVCRWREEKVGG